MCKDHGGLGVIGEWQCRRETARRENEIRERTIREMNGQLPAARTDRPRDFMAVVGGIAVVFAVASGAIIAFLHVLVIIAAALAGLVVVAGAGFVTWRVRGISRQARYVRTLIPAPPPQAPMLTRVHDVTVLPASAIREIRNDRKVRYQ